MLGWYFEWKFALLEGLFYVSYFSHFGAFLFDHEKYTFSRDYVLKYFYDYLIQLIIPMCAKITWKVGFFSPA